jgi:hypothetical protein
MTFVLNALRRIELKPVSRLALMSIAATLAMGALGVFVVRPAFGYIEQAFAADNPHIAAEASRLAARIERNKQREREATLKVLPKVCTPGEPQCPNTLIAKNIDIDVLAYAVGKIETNNCNVDRGSALLNNCHGFKVKGKFIAFETQEESYAYFKKLWLTKYCDCLPTPHLAKKYSGSDGILWRQNVIAVYHQQLALKNSVSLSQ